MHACPQSLASRQSNSFLGCLGRPITVLIIEIMLVLKAVQREDMIRVKTRKCTYLPVYRVSSFSSLVLPVLFFCLVLSVLFSSLAYVNLLYFISSLFVSCLIVCLFGFFPYCVPSSSLSIRNWLVLSSPFEDHICSTECFFPSIVFYLFIVYILSDMSTCSGIKKIMDFAFQIKREKAYYGM